MSYCNTNDPNFKTCFIPQKLFAVIWLGNIVPSSEKKKLIN